MDKYDHKAIEAKWQKKWLEDSDWTADDSSLKPKFYSLIEFPYPSGDGMHVGHLRSNTAMDVISRKRRAEGFNVLFPIGWDAFGLPAENYALKTGIHPKITTKQNTDTFRRQLQSLGFSFDWSREINTTDPKYYKWTQWIFLQFQKEGLAYKATIPINWCPKDKIGLANEEVVDGACERCGTIVEQKEKEQWMLAITKYSDRLKADIDDLDFITPVKKQQKNWIDGLRDWVFSRQRYWGEPIPMINCAKCGWVPVKDEDLPVELPDLAEFKPTENGESPLIFADDWVNTICPNCGGSAKRETDTMPNWAGSSWYFLAYAMFDSLLKNNEKWDSDLLKKWMPVDWYNGGMEHTTLHLLYSRFWNKFLFDHKLVPTSEPYKKRTSHGLILAEGGEKMSKSKGNVVNPDSVVDVVGADTLRLYILFIGPFDQPVGWQSDGIAGPRRFLERTWNLCEKINTGSKVRSLVHKTIRKINDHIEAMEFNTAVSTMMILLNDFEKDNPTKSEYLLFLKLLSPMAPHITEELWEKLGQEGSIHKSEWPKYDESAIALDEIKIAIQFNGKVRGILVFDTLPSEDQVLERVKIDPNLLKYLQMGEIAKTIYVPGKLLSIVQ